MDERISIVRYKRSDRDRTFDLIRAAYPEERARRLIAQWDWKFDRNPFNAEAERARRAAYPDLLGCLGKIYPPGRLERFNQKWRLSSELLAPQREDDPYVLLMINESGQAIGMDCSLPQRYRIGPAERWVSIGCDWALRPEYRNQHLSLALGNRLRCENGMNSVWTNTRSEGLIRSWRKAALPWHGASGLYQSTDYRRLMPLVKARDWRYVADTITQNPMLAQIIAASGATATRATGIVARGSAKDLELAEIEDFDERFDRLWEPCRSDHAVIAFRDSRYLHWRFRGRPNAWYTVLAAARRSEVVGYIVIRIVIVDSVEWGYIVDYLVENESQDILAFLVQHAEERLSTSDVKGFVVAIAAPPYRTTLIRSGYLPSIFRRESYLRSTMNNGDPAMRPFTDLGRWFVTMADGDIEMAF